MPKFPGLPAGRVEHDQATGRPCLKLPLPEPEVIEKLTDALGALAGRVQT